MEQLLLKHFLELYLMNKETGTWSLEKFTDNPPRLYRLQMIDSLFAALDIKCSYDEFKYGEFITEERMLRWEDIKNIVLDYSELAMNNVHFDEKFFKGELQSVFDELMEYRLRLHGLLNIANGVIAASGLFLMSLNILNEINQKIIGEFEIVDKILCYIINPLGIQYLVEELQIKFGYPLIDIEEVDLDWI